MADGIILDKVGLHLGTSRFDFDCRLPAAKVIAVTGASGSGKSTLLNLIAGFETADSGRIEIAGRDVTAAHPSERPVSVIFQDNNLFAHLDLLTNIGLGISPSLRLTPADRQAIALALARVGLKGFENRMPATLSGGERQRAGFARALVRKRPVLLLDEPFAALDPGLRQDMGQLLLDLHRESANTVLIVSHDPEEVARLAGHAIFIDAGRIALSAPIGDFLQAGAPPALARFLAG